MLLLHLEGTRLFLKTFIEICSCFYKLQRNDTPIVGARDG